MPNGTIEKIPRDRAKLKEGANPSNFPEYPKYYQPKPQPRKSPKKRLPLKNLQSQQNKGSKKLPELQDKDNTINEHINETEHRQLDEVQADQEKDLADHQVDDNIVQTTSYQHETSVKPFSHIKAMSFPPGWAACESVTCTDLNIVHINDEIQIDKSITLKHEGTCESIEVKVRGKNYDVPAPTVIDITAIQKLIAKLETIKICQGTGFKHKKFSVFCSGGVSARAKRCTKCLCERNRLRKIETRKEKIKQRQKEKLGKRKMKTQCLKRSKKNLLLKVIYIKHYFPNKRCSLKMYRKCDSIYPLIYVSG